MRDLSIRGAGNILGKHAIWLLLILLVLRCTPQLLEEAIAKKQGRENKRQKAMQNLICRLMPICLVTIFLMKDRRLKFIREFVRLTAV